MTPEQRGYIAITAVALLSHAPSLKAGFIWLDHAHLEQGLALAQGSDWLALFAQGFAGTGYYRPLMSVSLSLDAWLGGAPLLYHAVTLVWHAAAAVLTAVAAHGLGLSRRAAWAAGLLFAVHPLTSIVANAIAFRSESMTAVALLALVTLHLRGKALASGAVLLAGALTKETALILGPLLIAALELFPPGPSTRSSLERRRLLTCEAGALLLAAGLRQLFAPSWRASPADLSAGEALGTRLASLGKSSLAVLLPLDVGVCDAFPVTPVLAWRSLLGLAIAAGIAYLAYRRRGPALLLLLSLLPSLQLVPVMRWWSPHYVYLPLCFAAMLAVEAVERRAESALRWAAPLALALGGLSLLEARRYESDERLWSHEVRLDATCREGHFYLGEVARAAGKLDPAATHYEQALQQTPGVLSYVDRLATLQNLGVTRLEQRRFDDASQAFRAALEITRDEATRRRLAHNLAVVELLRRQPAQR